MEFTLLGAVFVAILPLYGVLYWEARRGNAAACTRNLWDTAVTSIVIGVTAGRLAAMIAAGVNPLTHPADILIVRGGVATGVAAVAAIGTAAWLGRRELWPVLDGLAPAALAGLGGWDAGCLVRGTCLGTPSNLPWAVAQTGSDITRHPVGIYAALALLAGAAALAWWRNRRSPAPGMAAGATLAVAAAIRLATEPLQPALGSGPVWWYIVGLFAGTAVLIWSFRARTEPAER